MRKSSTRGMEYLPNMRILQNLEASFQDVRIIWIFAAFPSRVMKWMESNQTPVFKWFPPPGSNHEGYLALHWSGERSEIRRSKKCITWKLEKWPRGNIPFGNSQRIEPTFCSWLLNVQLRGDQGSSSPWKTVSSSLMGNCLENRWGYVDKTRNRAKYSKF